MADYNTIKKMRVALVYDRVNKWGGAERVLLALHRIFPNAPLYTSVYDKKKAYWARVFDPTEPSGQGVRTSFLQNIPFASSNHEMLAPLMPFAFESFTFDEYDLVISVTSEAAKGIITKPDTLHLCYCLTPTRYLWSGYDEYFGNKGLKLLSKPIVTDLRKWDLIASQRPDVLIAISKEVQKRIRKYYGRDSELVYPPATLYSSSDPPVFDPEAQTRRAGGESSPLRQGYEGQGSSKLQKFHRPSEALAKEGRLRSNNNDYFLVVSRVSKFTRYKRIDLAIEAANELKIPLKIVGEGSLRRELEEKARSSIEFVGKVSDEDLVEYYKNCKALIFPGNEDFGLVMVEAQMQGIPVIAYNGGGAKEIIIDPTDRSGSATGLLFDEQNVESLVKTLQKFEKVKFDPKACIQNAKRFDFARFKEDFLFVINKLI